MGSLWKYTCSTSVLRCTVCGETAYIVRWRRCHYVLDLLCGKCWSWAATNGLE